MVSSQPLLDELGDVFARKLRRPVAEVRSALELFAATFSQARPDPLEAPICRDADDDVVLATALAGTCRAIITGDQDLLVLDPFRGIGVLAPSAFWRWESDQEEP